VFTGAHAIALDDVDGDGMALEGVALRALSAELVPLALRELLGP
jgi:hypothetical protein